MCDWFLNNLFSILNLIVLIGLSLWGKAWVNKKKAELDKEIEGLKTSHSKELYIHKLQFEKEFEIYDYLWMKIAHFKKAAKNYLDIMPVDPNEESEFFDPFVKEWDELYETITIREPFMAEEVFDQTDKLIKIPEATLTKFKNPIKANQKELLEVKKEILKICEGIGEAIRGRINNMGKAKLFE